MALLIFQIFFSLLFLVFLLLISDFRNKKTRPLFQKVWLLVMRAGYLIPQICFLFFLWSLDSIRLYSILSMIIVSAGVLIITFSKKELGARHTWAGHAAQNSPDFCTSGIYAWIRHPIYLGIIVADIGMGFIVIPNMDKQLQLSLTFIIGCAITFIFIVVSSIKETRFLAEKFGQSFIHYASLVNGFLPLRKYSALLGQKANEQSKYPVDV